MSGLLTWFESLVAWFFFRPDVYIDIEHDQGQLHIVLANQGRSSAYRIRSEFESPLIGVEGSKQISDQALFHCTEFLPIGKRITTYLDSSQAYFNRDEPTLIKISLCYEDRFGHQFQREILHNLAIYQDIGYIKQ